MIKNEKVKFVFLICCVIVTVAIVFNVVTSFIQRNNIVREISFIDFSTYGIESELSSIRSSLRGIERELER